MLRLSLLGRLFRGSRDSAVSTMPVRLSFGDKTGQTVSRVPRAQRIIKYQPPCCSMFGIMDSLLSHARTVSRDPTECL